jgi:myosin heavy subunit
MEPYLLEKSRVVGPSKGERNYHIFYQIVAGATNEERVEFSIPKNASSWTYLATGGCVSVPQVNDSDEFKAVRDGLHTMGFSKETVRHMLATLSG